MRSPFSVMAPLDNFRGGYGNGGIIRSPLSAMTLLDRVFARSDLQGYLLSIQDPDRNEADCGERDREGKRRPPWIGDMRIAVRENPRDDVAMPAGSRRAVNV